MVPSTPFYRKHFTALFCILLFANLVMINILQQDAELLQSEHARFGIVSLQLNYSGEEQAQIIADWKAARKKVWTVTTDPTAKDEWLYGNVVAKTQTRKDFAFIGLYVLLLGLLASRLAPEGNRKSLRMSFTVIILAGIMDTLENLGTFRVLDDPQRSPLLVFLPALVKFLCLGIIIFLLVQWAAKRKLWGQFFRELSTFLVDTFGIIIKFRIVVFGLILMFFSLWLSDQGRDLLLIINNNPGGPILFLFMVTVLAALNWHLPKYYTSSNTPLLRQTGLPFIRFFSGQLPPREPAQEDHRYTARILGVLTFLITAVCILNALRLFHIPYTLDEVNPLLLGLFMVVLYHLAIREQWVEKFFGAQDDGTGAPAKAGLEKKILLSIFFIIALISLIGIIGHASATYYLAYLSVDLFLLSLAFFIFTTLRRCLPHNRLGTDVISRYILPIAGGISIIFIGLNFFPFPLGRVLRVVAIPVLLGAICFYTLVLTYLLLLGRRYRIRFITFLIIVCFVLSRMLSGSFHAVEFASEESKNKYPSGAPLRLDEYTRTWISAHLAEIDSFNAQGRPFPVFFVNAYGGGIRAAAWTAISIARLDSEMLRTGPTDFQHYVFSYSTASGGTIGASLLCATRFGKRDQAEKNFSPGKWSSWFRNDFLTPVLVGLLGRDLWYSSFGIWKAHDRAYLQEWTWEEMMKMKGMDQEYHLPMNTYWDRTYNTKMDVPLLFSNTYDIDGGLKGIVAPVALDTLDFPGSVFVNRLMSDTGDKLKLSTAAFLSARFPVISPTGKVDEFHHFMDGGLKENSGAETSRQVMAVFSREWNRFNTDSLKKRILKMEILCLPNSIGESDTLEKAKHVNEFTAPLTALMNNWIGNTKKADELNRIDTASFHNGYASLQPTQQTVDNFQPVLPLGWQISDYGLTEMTKSLDHQRDTIHGILRKIKPWIK